MLQAARAAAAEAELALAELDYTEAARLFGEAAALVPAGNPDDKGALITRQADALKKQGDERGDNSALGQAIKLYGCALELMTHERRAARLGRDAEQPRQRAFEARGTRERHGAAGGGGRSMGCMLDS